MRMAAKARKRIEFFIDCPPLHPLPDATFGFLFDGGHGGRFFEIGWTVNQEAPLGAHYQALGLRGLVERVFIHNLSFLV